MTISNIKIQTTSYTTHSFQNHKVRACNLGWSSCEVLRHFIIVILYVRPGQLNTLDIHMSAVPGYVYSSRKNEWYYHDL